MKELKDNQGEAKKLVKETRCYPSEIAEYTAHGCRLATCMYVCTLRQKNGVV